MKTISISIIVLFVFDGIAIGLIIAAIINCLLDRKPKPKTYDIQPGDVLEDISDDFFEEDPFKEKTNKHITITGVKTNNKGNQWVEYYPSDKDGNDTRSFLKNRYTMKYRGEEYKKVNHIEL